MTEDNLRISFHAAPHKADIEPAMVGHFANSSTHVREVAALGNAAVDAQGVRGVTMQIRGTMTLAEARPLLGTVTSGRVGLYQLSGPPPAAARTTAKFSGMLQRNKVAETHDDYGEEYGAANIGTALGTPWTPQLNNGHAKDNFVQLVRSKKSQDYAIAVHSNAHPQFMQAIDAAIAANPAVTVTEFMRSPEMARVSEVSDLQNQRIALRFAQQTGLSPLVKTQNHLFERTAPPPYGAPVQYAVPTSMSRYGEFAPSSAVGIVRVPNRAVDLTRVTGTGVVQVNGLANGVQLHRPRGGAAMEPALYRKNQTFNTVAATHYDGKRAPLSEHEKEVGQSVLHWSGKGDSNAGFDMIQARLESRDTAKVAFSEQALKKSGISPKVFETVKYKPLGGVIVP